MINDTTTIAPANIPSHVPQNTAAASTPAAPAITVGTIMGSSSNARTTTAATQAIAAAASTPAALTNTVVTVMAAPTTAAAASHLLHRQFVQLGRERNKITYKLLALLPKIYKARIHETEGYATIYEYAGKLAGLSRPIVEKTLNLGNTLIDKPHLQRAIETQGIHKVAIVARLATPENEQMFADKVENMSKSALTVWSKELRQENIVVSTSQTKLCLPEKPKMKIELDDEMEFLFLKLKKEMKEQRLSNKEFLRRLLKKMASESQMMHKRQKPAATSQSAPKIPGEKIAKITKTLSNHTPKKDKHIAQAGTLAATLHRATRYIRITTKRAALAITNGKCAHEGCNKPYEVLHHVERFAAGGNHESIIPLCKEHHEFAHNGLLKEDRVDRSRASEKVGGFDVGRDEVGHGRKSEKAGNIDLGKASRDNDSEMIDLLYKKYRLAAIA